MDKIEEIKNLKKLLDNDAITEEEFSEEKAKILGIKSQNEREEEKKQKDLEKEQQEFFAKQKLKEKARLEVEQEMRRIENERQNEKIKKNINISVSNGKKAFMWILSIICIITSIGFFGTIKTNVGLYLSTGLIFFVLGIMACPSITKKTKQYKLYTNIKKYIIILLIVLFVILASVM